MTLHQTVLSAFLMSSHASDFKCYKAQSLLPVLWSCMDIAFLLIYWHKECVYDEDRHGLLCLCLLFDFVFALNRYFPVCKRKPLDGAARHQGLFATVSGQ